MVYTATIEKEWAEVRRPGRGKVEDWTYCVTMCINGMVDDVCWLKTEADAKMLAIMYELGEFTRGEYDAIESKAVFEDMENVDD